MKPGRCGKGGSRLVSASDVSVGLRNKLRATKHVGCTDSTLWSEGGLC